MIPYDFKRPFHTPSFWRSIGIGYKVGQDLTDTQLDEMTHDAITHAIQREKAIRFISRDNPTGTPTHYEIKYGEKIGEGAFASIYDCVVRQKTSTGRLLSETAGAIKLINPDSIALRDILIEITVHAYLSRITHYVPRLIRVGFIHADEQEPRAFIVMEKMEGGTTLDALIKSSTPAKADKYVMQTFVEMGRMLHYLQKVARFVHSDLHPENIYVKLKPDGSVKSLMMIDFGLSSIQMPHSRHRIGSEGNFISKFDTKLDMSFLAFTLMHKYPTRFGKLLCAALRELCSDSRKVCMLDDAIFEDIEDWSLVLTCLHKMSVDKRTRAPKAISICFAMMSSISQKLKI